MLGYMTKAGVCVCAGNARRSWASWREKRHELTFQSSYQRARTVRASMRHSQTSVGMRSIAGLRKCEVDDVQSVEGSHKKTSDII